MSSLSDKHETRECVVAIRGKTTVLMTTCHKDCLHYASSVKAVVSCFEFTTFVVARNLIPARCSR